MTKRPVDQSENERRQNGIVGIVEMRLVYLIQACSKHVSYTSPRLCFIVIQFEPDQNDACYGKAIVYSYLLTDHQLSGLVKR
jgi:hypothetical protein